MTLSDPSAQVARSLPRASVIIPTYNRRKSLLAVLRALARQTLPADQFEVLVIADGCTDGTLAVCRELALEVPYVLRLLEQSNTGPAEARNRGVREASAPLIVFVDDDVVPSAELLVAHLAAHSLDGEDNVVAIGPLLPPLDMRLNAWGAWEERALCGQYAAMESGRWVPTHRQFYTGNASVARRHILRAGGFNPQFRRAEDIELGVRLESVGCTFAFVPHARAWHYVRRSFGSWAAMPVAYGRANVMMARTGRTWVLELDMWFYSRRNLATRLLTRLCVGSPLRVTVATQAFHLLATVGWAVRMSLLAYAVCSVMYNLRFYAGVATGLGSSRTLWRLVKVAAMARKVQRQELLTAACVEALERTPAAQHVPAQAQTGASV